MNAAEEATSRPGDEARTARHRMPVALVVTAAAATLVGLLALPWYRAGFGPEAQDLSYRDVRVAADGLRNRSFPLYDSHYLVWGPPAALVLNLLVYGAARASGRWRTAADLSLLAFAVAALLGLALQLTDDTMARDLDRNGGRPALVGLYVAPALLATGAALTSRHRARRLFGPIVTVLAAGEIALHLQALDVLRGFTVEVPGSVPLEVHSTPLRMGGLVTILGLAGLLVAALLGPGPRAE